MDTWVSEFLWPSQSFSGAPNMSRCRRGPTWTSWRRSRSRRRSHGGRCWGCGGSRTLRSPSSSWSLGSPLSVLVRTMRVWEEDLAGGENSRGEERKWKMCLDETSSSGQVVRILDWIGHEGGEKQMNLWRGIIYFKLSPTLQAHLRSYIVFTSWEIGFLPTPLDRTCGCSSSLGGKMHPNSRNGDLK